MSSNGYDNNHVSSASRNGFESFKAGVRLTENPYNERSQIVSRKDWAHGWQRAESRSRADSRPALCLKSTETNTHNFKRGAALDITPGSEDSDPVDTGVTDRWSDEG